MSSSCLNRPHPLLSDFFVLARRSTSNPKILLPLRSLIHETRNLLTTNSSYALRLNSYPPTMDFNSLKDQVSNLTLYDIKAGVRKVQNGKLQTRELNSSSF